MAHDCHSITRISLSVILRREHPRSGGESGPARHRHGVGGVNGTRWVTASATGMNLEVEVGGGAGRVARSPDIADDGPPSDATVDVGPAQEVGAVVVVAVLAPQMKRQTAEG